MTIFRPGQNRQPLLLLHGTGGSERDLLPIGRLLDPAAPLLAIGGRVVENGQARYFRHTANGDVDQSDLEHQTTWLLTTAMAALANHGLAKRPITVVGYSNGANIAAYALLNRVTPFACAILFHATTVSAQNDPNLPAIPTWLSFGTNDPYVSPAAFAALSARLQQNHAPLTIYRHAHGHRLTHAELLAARDWLQRILKGV